MATVPVQERGAEHAAGQGQAPPKVRVRTWGRYVSPVIGLGIVVVVVFLALAAPALAPHDPYQQNIAYRLQPPSWMDGGDPDFPLGTDTLGRDILSRMLYGARASLLIGALAVLVGGVVGVTTGVIAGYYEGSPPGIVLGRLADVQQAIPVLILALAVVAAVGPSLRNLVLVLGVGSWLFYFRVVRGEVLAVREMLFIDAAKVVGCSSLRIIGVHVLPNVLPSILVVITLFVPQLIIYSAALSFLGLGVQAPTPEWGLMISEGRDFLRQAWWLSVFPGVMLALTVLGINMVGDWLRDQIDPVQRRSA